MRYDISTNENDNLSGEGKNSANVISIKGVQLKPPLVKCRKGGGLLDSSLINIQEGEKRAKRTRLKNGIYQQSDLKS